IVTASDPSSFAVQPAVSPDGTLTYTPAPTAAGPVTLTVSMHDDGGIADGGVDGSVDQQAAVLITIWDPVLVAA
ncbi:MAG: hypothetical protein WCI87_04370, partial [Euryarchaeota archaeon]